MKVLLAVHHFPPTFSGGAEWRAYRTARGLQQEEHDVRVVCVNSISHGDGRTLDCSDTFYDRMSVRRLSFNLARVPDSFRWSFHNPLIEQDLIGLLEKFKPDVLHLIGGYLISGSAIEAAQATDVPVVVTLTDFWFLCPRITLLRSDGTLCCPVPCDPLECLLCLCKERRRYRIPDRLSRGLLGRMLLRLWQLPGGLSIWGFSALALSLQERRAYLLSLLNTVDTIIAPSQFLKALFAAQGVHQQRFVYLRQGLAWEHWAPAVSASSNSHLRIGYIGQVAKHKGVDVLIEAFCRLQAGGRQLELVLYGDLEQFPAYVRGLRRSAKRRGEIVFAGRFDNTQVKQVHAGLDVLVVPSVWYENSPNVILEAFAAGTPIVVSDVGGMAELVQHGVNGLQFKMGDAEDLARQLQRIVDQPDLLELFRQNLPAVKTTAQEIAELVQIYRSVVEENGGS